MSAEKIVSTNVLLPVSTSHKQKRLIFTLRDESSANDESSSDAASESEFHLDMEEENVPVFEEDPITGVKHESVKLSYKMTSVEERIGVKINLKDLYFDANAQQSYAEKGKRLMKFVKNSEEEEEQPSPTNLKKQKIKGEEKKENPVLNKQMTQYVYITPQRKFDVLGQYFGVTSLKLEPTGGNIKKQKKQIKSLFERGCIIQNNAQKMREVVKILKKSPEKRNEKDVVQLVPLLKQLSFFKERKPMDENELQEVAQNIQYLNCEPGDTIFKQGDFGDKYFIILKGKIQVQIPDPLGTGLIEPKIIKQEIVEEEEVIEEDKNIKLTKQQIDALPPKEQRRYKTKMMLTDILSSQNVVRSTISPGQAVLNASKIQQKLIVAPVIQIQTPVESPKATTVKEVDSPNPNTFITTNPNETQQYSECAEQEAEEEEQENMPDDLQLQIVAKPTKDDELDPNDGDQIDPVSLIEPGMIDIARLEGGCSFGELALLDGKPRMATIKSLTRSHLMVLSKQDYEKTLLAIDSKRRALKVNFVKKIPIFSKLTRTFLTKLSYSLKPLRVTRDCFLYKEGDPADRVFIVQDGEFMVTKKLVSKNKLSENIQEILENPQRACKLQNKFFAKNSVKQVDRHTLGYIGPGNLIGEEDVIGSAEYTTTVKCISQDAELIYILKDDFDRLKQQTTTWNSLLTLLNDKMMKQMTAVKQTTKARQKINESMNGVYQAPEGSISQDQSFQTTTTTKKQQSKTNAGTSPVRSMSPGKSRGINQNASQPIMNLNSSDNSTTRNAGINDYMGKNATFTSTTSIGKIQVNGLPALEPQLGMAAPAITRTSIQKLAQSKQQNQIFKKNTINKAVSQENFGAIKTSTNSRFFNGGNAANKRRFNNIQSMSFANVENKIKPQAALFGRGQVPKYLNPLGHRYQTNPRNTNLEVYGSASFASGHHGQRRYDRPQSFVK